MRLDGSGSILMFDIIIIIVIVIRRIDHDIIIHLICVVMVAVGILYIL